MQRSIEALSTEELRRKGPLPILKSSLLPQNQPVTPVRTGMEPGSAYLSLFLDRHPPGHGDNVTGHSPSANPDYSVTGVVLPVTGEAPVTKTA
jgi:hypothetical protein